MKTSVNIICFINFLAHRDKNKIIQLADYVGWSNPVRL